MLPLEIVMNEAPRSTKTTRIVEKGSLHKYRTEIPNTVIRGVKSRDLSVYAKWLYVYLKSVAGDESVCFRSTTTIALESGMSRGQASEAKQELVSKGLVTIKKGKNPRRDADHIRIKDIWLANMQEFCVHNTNTINDSEDAVSQQVSESSVHNMNSDDRQCSQYELSVHNMNSVFTIRTKEDPIKKEPIKKEDNSLTTFESYPGAVNSVHTPGQYGDASPVTVVALEKPKNTPKPINPEEWPGLTNLLTAFELPLTALNDNDWWNDLSYTCNSPTNQWLEREFAKMHAWLRENPRRTPTKGWKRFVRTWLERAYEHDRRTTYATQKNRQR
jgi:hypothetical protein